jgi:hypothetical protein
MLSIPIPTKSVGSAVGSSTPRKACIGPGIYLAPGTFSAVSGSKEAASRSQIDPRKPDVASGAFYLPFEEEKSCSC